MQRTELIFILTPAMAGLFLCILLRIIMVTVEDGMPALLYDTYPALRLLIPAILLLSLLSILYSVKLFQDMVSLNREKSSRIILEQQIETLQKHIGEIERLYTGVRSIKHDMKNTLTVLMRLFSEKETEKTPELTAYLSELNQSFDRLDFRFRTGNAVADALLNMKYHEITERIPELSFQADNLLFPEDLTVQSYDIGVILGNALDNALEGCIRLKQKELKSVPFIRLISFRRGKYFFLEIENSFDGRLLRDHRSEFPTTLKNDRQALEEVMYQHKEKLLELFELRLIRGEVRSEDEWSEYFEGLHLRRCTYFASAVEVLNLRDDASVLVHGEDPEKSCTYVQRKGCLLSVQELPGNILQKRERRAKKKSNRKERTNISKFLEKGGYVSIWI